MRSFFLLLSLTFALSGLAGSGDAPLQFRHRAAKAEKAPVIILLHGYGSNELDLFSFPMLPECHVFSLRAPFEHPNGGFSWFGLEFAGGGRFNFNYAQAKESRNKILAFIRWACREYKADSTLVTVVGFSQGAMMGYELALHAPGNVAGVAALSGGIVPESKTGITRHIKGMPLFLGHGRLDDVVEYRYSVEAKDFLDKQGARVTFKSYNHGHNISGVEVGDISSWIRSTILKH